MKGRVLIIAGSDPSGGAGIQADIKTVTALGGYAAAAITALTVQNTYGVTAVHGTPPDVIAAQIDAVMEDIGADAIKIGMIGGAAAAQTIHDALVRWAGKIPVVLDPVLAATSGDELAGAGVADAIMTRLAPSMTLLTPNIEEASLLTGFSVVDRASMIRAGECLLAAGAGAALLTGGHLQTDPLEDILVAPSGNRIFFSPRIETTSTHGTGCTLASAIATGLAQGYALEPAIERAVAYVQSAVRDAPGLGGGHGPLNHAHTVRSD